MAELLDIDHLPDGFTYPREFVRIVELGLVNLEPWWILEGELLCERFTGMSKRYPSRSLVPFAHRQDNDDVACWDLDRGGVSVIHDYASPGYEQRTRYDGFIDWFRAAIDDLIDFD